MNDLPRFEHDCTTCKFLGRFNEYDLYVHNNTVLARYGSDGPDYLSGDLDYVAGRELMEAARRAKL